MAIKCKEEIYLLKQFIDAFDDILRSDKSSLKKNVLCQNFYRRPTTFRCFFKLYSKKAIVEVISEKYESYKKRIEDSKANDKEVLEIGAETTQEEFDKNM